MKNLLFLALISCFLMCCRKEIKSPETQVTTGTLRYYDPAVDGPGLYYQTDGEETLLFKNHFADYTSQYLYYKAWLDKHSRLTFKDYGETGCTLGMLPCELQTKLRVVEVVDLRKE